MRKLFAAFVASAGILAIASTACTVSVSLSCPGSTVDCNGVCTDLSIDDNSCGACGNVCAGSEVCVGGGCVTSSVTCPSNTDNCGNVCTDVSQDPDNCGFCGYACATNEFCIGGACAVDTGNSPPDIISASVTDSPVPQNPDGSYDVDISVDFSDASEDVNGYDFASFAANIFLSGSFAPTPAGTVAITVHLPVGTATGTMDFYVDVVSVSGLTSNHVTGQVVLE